MKYGKSLAELAAEIDRQQNAKRDFTVPTQKLQATPAEVGGITLDFTNGAEHKYPLQEIAHRQLGEHLQIPAKYYDRMKERQPELLAKSVNTWMTEAPSTRLLRVLDGQLRAFLSDGYRPLDNYDLCQVVLPIVGEMGVEIVSAEVTERKLYIKAVDKRILKDVPTGRKIGDGSHVFFDTLSPAIEISNSEVGYGQLSVQTGVLTSMCTNLAWIAGGGMKRRHVGARLGEMDSIQEMLADDTRRATDKAVFLQARDVIRGAFDEMRFAATVKAISATTEQKIEGQIVEVTGRLAERFGLVDHERENVLKHLIEGGDLSRYGLHAAVTRTAEDAANYDRASELERLGGKIIELETSEWKELAKAA